MHRSARRALNLSAVVVLGALGLGVLAFGVGRAGAAEAKSETEAWRRVDCEIQSASGRLSGPCRFVSEKGGSFALANADGEATLIGEVVMVSVAVVSPGVAEVRGLTTAGINSRWGEARRSTSDPACWEGSDFRICAR